MIAVILAAGAGRRLGRGPKALLKLGPGPAAPTLAERAAATALHAGLTPLLLTAPHVAGTVRALLPAGAHVEAVPDHATGLSASLKQAAKWVKTQHPDEPIMLWLVDQPGIGVEVVRRLSVAHQSGSITRASYAGVPAHPVVFDAPDFQEAAATADGDVGAKEFLKTQRHRVTLIDCGDIGTAADLDTEADYRAWADGLEA